MNDKIKVLALGDYACTTGFATVMSNVMRQLHATGKYELDIVGINFTGDPYDQEQYPGRVYPAINLTTMQTGDLYGRQRFLDLLGTGEYDVVFVLQDTFIMLTIMPQILGTYEELKKKNGKLFSTVFYYPLDAAPKREWIEKCVGLIDYPVTYTGYAFDETVKIMPSLKDKLQVVYHGTNPKDFYPIENREEVANFRHNYFNGAADNRFLITNINRNQPRKDVIRSFMVLDELKKRGRNPVLYLHMAHDDAGGNLLVMADHFGFKLQEDYILPHPKVFNANRGVPTGMLNFIYNASDAYLTTTLGEGWGLGVTEAMATRLPVVAPNNTSLTEILAEGRGWLAQSGVNPSNWFCLGSMDNERLRPLMDVKLAADHIAALMDGQKPDIDAAYAWTQQYTWEQVCAQWQQIFDKAALDARTATKYGSPVVNREMRRKVKS